MYLAQQACFLKQGRPTIAPSSLSHVPQASEHHSFNEIPRVRPFPRVSPHLMRSSAPAARLQQMRLNRRFDLDTVEPTLRPQCASLDSPKSPLRPLEKGTKGFKLWEMPGYNGRKKFWRGEKIGDTVTFEVEFTTGSLSVPPPPHDGARAPS